MISLAILTEAVALETQSIFPEFVVSLDEVNYMLSFSDFP